MCRDILNTCVRNTEEAEKSNLATTTSSGRGFGKGVWGMIEDSKLAKHLKTEDEEAEKVCHRGNRLRDCSRFRFYPGVTLE